LTSPTFPFNPLAVTKISPATSNIVSHPILNYLLLALRV
jgi:hypothetical protein